MFTTMIHSLQQGILPDRAELSQRFNIAVVKKMGFLKQPYLFWPNDPKINPLAHHLLWATVILDDKEKFDLIAGVLVTEYLEAKPNPKTDPGKLQETLTRQALDELLAICGNNPLHQDIVKKLTLLAPFNE